MSTELILSKSIQIKAPSHKVWEALTKPELIAKYFFGTKTETDWKKGSKIRFTGEWEGKAYEDKGTILDIVPGKLIRYNYLSSWSGLDDRPENYAVIQYILEEHKGYILLTVTQDNFATKEAKEHSDKNWSDTLQSIKNMVETEM